MMHRLPGRNPSPRGTKIANSGLKFTLIAMSVVLLCNTSQASIIVSGNTNVPNVLGHPNGPLDNVDVMAGIDSTGSLQVTNGSVLNTQSVFLGVNTGGNGNFTVNNSDANLSGQLYVGFRGKGTATIEQGAQLNTHGVNIDSQGKMLVNGNGTGWQNQGDIKLGTFGDGQLTIAQGASVTSTGKLHVGIDSSGHGKVNIQSASLSSNGAVIGDNSSGLGEVVVEGTGAHWTNNADLTIGAKQGAGFFTVRDHAIATVANGITLGESDGSTGYISVSGANTYLGTQHGQTDIGQAGYGTVAVVNGGLLETGLSNLGDEASGYGVAHISGAQTENAHEYQSTWRVNGNLNVGNQGTGVLQIDNQGLLQTQTSEIGRLAGSHGSVLVSGLGSKWQNNGGLIVGDFGTGSLDVNDNAAVTSSEWLVVANAGKGDVNINNGYLSAIDVTFGYSQSGKGNMAITNDGDLNVVNSMTIGDRGEGTVNVLSGSRIYQSSGDIVLGNNTSSQGTLAVSEADSNVMAQHSDVTVGKVGNGELFVSDGASMNVKQLVIGDQAGSNGFTAVFGSQSKNSILRDATLIVNEHLVVGNAGHATLDINDRGQVNSNGAIVANQSGSEATVYVSGEGSRWKNNNSLSVGDSGKANVTIHSGGTLDNRGNTIVGNNKDSAGQLNLHNNGQMLTASLVAGNKQGSTGEINVTGQGSNLSSIGGTIIVANQGQATLSIGDQGQVRTYLADVKVANQAGSVGTLEFGIGNGTSFMFGSADMVADSLLDIDGDLFLGTTLQGLPSSTALFNMVLDKDFGSVALGSSFILASYEQLFGTFDNLFDNDLSDGIAWLIDGFNFNIFYDFDLGNGLKGLVAQYLGTESPINQVSEPGVFMLMLFALLAMFSRNIFSITRP